MNPSETQVYLQRVLASAEDHIRSREWRPAFVRLLEALAFLGWALADYEKALPAEELDAKWQEIGAVDGKPAVVVARRLAPLTAELTEALYQKARQTRPQDPS